MLVPYSIDQGRRISECGMETIKIVLIFAVTIRRVTNKIGRRC